LLSIAALKSAASRRFPEMLRPKQKAQGALFYDFSIDDRVPQYPLIVSVTSLTPAPCAQVVKNIGQSLISALQTKLPLKFSVENTGGLSQAQSGLGLHGSALDVARTSGQLYAAP
jgi:hypothetical protein